MEGKHFQGEPYALRKPCKFCGETMGVIRTVGPSDTVRCKACGEWLYNAPRVETGRKARTVTTVHQDIKPKDRARILLRASGRCELCGSREDLHVGHLLSVDAGMKLGMTEVDLNSDENLACFCACCNLGMGKHPVPVRLLVAILLTRIAENSDGSNRADEGADLFD